MCGRSTGRRVHLPLAVALALCSARSLAQIAATEDNPLLGTWTLLVEKSRYKPGPLPQRQTRTYEAAPHGVKTTIRTVTADGKSTVEYTANYDSIEYHVSGSATANGTIPVYLPTSIDAAVMNVLELEVASSGAVRCGFTSC